MIDHLLQIRVLQILVLQIRVLQIQSVFYKSNPVRLLQYARHSRIINLACNGVESHVTRMAF